MAVRPKLALVCQFLRYWERKKWYLLQLLVCEVQNIHCHTLSQFGITFGDERSVGMLSELIGLCYCR